MEDAVVVFAVSDAVVEDFFDGASISKIRNRYLLLLPPKQLKTIQNDVIFWMTPWFYLFYSFSCLSIIGRWTPTAAAVVVVV